MSHSFSLSGVSQLQAASAAESESWYWRGVALADEGQYAAALSWFDQGLNQQPLHLKGWVFRCVVLIHLERYEEALESCGKALEIQPDDAETWTFRGVALHRLSRYREAYASYERALGRTRATGWRRLLGWLHW
ncbi:tetratricopeptide repeat protein [Leptolyngbya sp. AN02str]|uniref:tetratricopeptide repeat protein n=1 Tax=Leptolyngbya sp. AN02str TaxID=3423363 RepID=UPI003D3132E3